jgi:hypothetical protein
MQSTPSGTRKLSALQLHDQLNDSTVAHKVAVLTHGPEPSDLKNGHLLYWNKEETKPLDTGSYLFDSAAARAFREKHETFMQLILEKEVLEKV